MLGSRNTVISKKWIFPCIHERQLTGASGNWELQAASLFSTAENSAIWVFPKSISYSPTKEKAGNPLDFIYGCTARWQAFHNTWTCAFMGANFSEGLHTWLLIPSPQEWFLGERGSPAPEHTSQLPASLLSLCCSPAMQPLLLHCSLDTRRERSRAAHLDPELQHSTWCSPHRSDLFHSFPPLSHLDRKHTNRLQGHNAPATASSSASNCK